MTFRFTTTPQQLSFERIDRRRAYGLVVFVALLFMLVGIFVLLWGEALFGAFFAALGFLIFLVGVFSPDEKKRIIPKRFVFNNTAGRLDVVMSATGRQSFIPYAEIEGFFQHTLRFVKGGYQREIHLIYVRKKDGGVWFVYDHVSKRNADDVFQQLVAGVNLQAPLIAPTQTAGLGGLKNVSTPQRPVLEWGGEIGWLGLLIVGLFIGMFGLIPASMILDPTASSSKQAGGWVLAVVVSLAFVVTIALLLRKMLQIHRISFDAQHLNYTTRFRFLGGNEKRTALPLRHVVRVVFSFMQTDQEIIAPEIFLLTKEQAEKVSTRERKPEQPIDVVFWENDKPLSLPITGLTPVDGLALEHWLQAQISNRSGLPVA